MNLLGSTGSIGTQTLDVIRPRRNAFAVVGLAATGRQPELLARQIAEFQPQAVAVSDETTVDNLGHELTKLEVAFPRILSGEAGLLELAASPCDVVVNAITGAAGLQATVVTLEAGTTLALANKESLVIGGTLVRDRAKPGQLVAVDSEHSAIAQALRCGRAEEVRRVILTASGGPFRGRTTAELLSVTPAQAMAHPTWNMGRVITINSATLVNKGLELIEAALLYQLDFDDIHVVVHPQSIIHSAVEFIDGSTIAQASPPDMRLPIALGLNWPNRIAAASPPCDWSQATAWTFEPLDNKAFPAVELARKAGKLGGTAPAVYNAANEECVDAFCAGDLNFVAIVATIAQVLEEHLTVPSHKVGWAWLDDDSVTISSVLAADAWARQRVREALQRGDT